MRCMLENNLEIWRKKIFIFHEKYDDFDKKVKINGDKMRWDKIKMRYDWKVTNIQERNLNNLQSRNIYILNIRAK